MASTKSQTDLEVDLNHSGAKHTKHFSIKFTTTPLTSPLRLGYNYLIKSSIIQCSPLEKATWMNCSETHIFCAHKSHYKF